MITLFVICDHCVIKDISIPKHATLYKYRIDLDLASMIWARKHRFGVDTKWYLHCRLDSSPQFGRDYLMTEVDIFYPSSTLLRWQDMSKEGVLYTRLLTGQMVGARASGSIVKTRKLLHTLAMAARICLDKFFLTLTAAAVGLKS